MEGESVHGVEAKHSWLAGQSTASPPGHGVALSQFLSIQSQLSPQNHVVASIASCAVGIGCGVGFTDGLGTVGCTVGRGVGFREGSSVGSSVGSFVGAGVGILSRHVVLAKHL